MYKTPKSAEVGLNLFDRQAYKYYSITCQYIHTSNAAFFGAVTIHHCSIAITQFNISRDYKDVCFDRMLPERFLKGSFNFAGFGSFSALQNEYLVGLNCFLS